MDAKLVVVGGEAKTAEIKLKLPSIVGRGRDASLTLPHPLVSRQHCEIFESSGRLFVRDMGSLNGTYINNERIEGDRELPSGELLTIGTVTFRAIYADDANDYPPDIDEAMAPVVQQGAAVPPNAATVQVGAGTDDPPLAMPVDVADAAETDEYESVDDDEFDFEDMDAEDVEFDEAEAPPAPFAQTEAANNDDTSADDDLNAFLQDLE